MTERNFISANDYAGWPEDPRDLVPGGTEGTYELPTFNRIPRGAQVAGVVATMRAAVNPGNTQQ